MESMVRKIRNFIVKIKIQEFEEVRRGVGGTLVRLVCDFHFHVTSSLGKI